MNLPLLLAGSSHPFTSCPFFLPVGQLCLLVSCRRFRSFCAALASQSPAFLAACPTKVNFLLTFFAPQPCKVSPLAPPSAHDLARKSLQPKTQHVTRFNGVFYRRVNELVLFLFLFISCFAVDTQTRTRTRWYLTKEASHTRAAKAVCPQTIWPRARRRSVTPTSCKG